MSEYEYSDPPRQALLPLFLIMGGVSAVFLLCGGVLFLAGGAGKTGAVVPIVPTATTAAATSGDPYPECAAVRAWLRDHTGEPESMEVVKWGKRHVVGKGSIYFPAGTVTLELTFRGKNNVGGKQVWTYNFIFDKGGAVVSGYDSDKQNEAAARALAPPRH
jgi:hypothetical protein